MSDRPITGQPLRSLLNGVVPHGEAALALDDRGLQYGDGLFETARIAHGRICFLEEHLARLAAGCGRLGIPAPDPAVLARELATLAVDTTAGIVKIIVTRGAGTRGYRPAEGSVPTRLLMLYPGLDPQEVAGQQARGIRVRWCATRLARTPVLAGLKHLNRLEQVLAQAEWSDPDIAEGLQLDTEGEVISGTASNLFLVRDGILLTPDLRYSGVRGVLRGRVIGAAQEQGIPVEEQPLWSTDVEEADEVFVTNALRGIRPVVALDVHDWTIGPLTRRLAAQLAR